LLAAIRVRYDFPIMRRTRIIGRPPAGLNGEQVQNYPQLSVRVPPETRRALRALARAEGRPIWRVLADAIACYDGKHRHH